MYCHKKLNHNTILKKNSKRDLMETDRKTQKQKHIFTRAKDQEPETKCQSSNNTPLLTRGRMKQNIFK